MMLGARTHSVCRPLQPAVEWIPMQTLALSASELLSSWPGPVCLSIHFTRPTKSRANLNQKDSTLGFMSYFLKFSIVLKQGGLEFDFT